MSGNIGQTIQSAAQQATGPLGLNTDATQEQPQVSAGGGLFGNVISNAVSAVNQSPTQVSTSTTPTITQPVGGK
jgi:flagellar hook-basal body complex protein FliE